MLTSLARYIQGYLKIRIRGASAERFINACRYRGIPLWDIRVCPDHSYEMFLPVSGFRKLRPILRKTGMGLMILEKRGALFLVSRLRRRKMFLAGICVFFLFLYGMSLFVWEIDLRGNSERTDETLYRYLESLGVKPGTRKSDIRCPDIVNALREEYDNIIWASASMEGCRLMIQMKENEDGQEAAAAQDGTKNGQPYDLVADFDGVIVSRIVRAGVGLKNVGDTVAEGEVLVSGQVPVENDSGETIGYQYQAADADIVASTELPYADACPNEAQEKEYIEEVYKLRVFLQVRGRRLFFGELKNTYEYLELTGMTYTLPFVPVAAGYQKIVPYRVHTRLYSEDEQTRVLSGRFLQYQEDLAKKGVEIIENNVRIYTGSTEAAAKGTLTVQGPIGIRKPSRILPLPERKEDE